MQNHGPKPLNRAQKAMTLRTAGVQVQTLSSKYVKKTSFEAYFWAIWSHSVVVQGKYNQSITPYSPFPNNDQSWLDKGLSAAHLGLVLAGCMAGGIRTWGAGSLWRSHTASRGRPLPPPNLGLNGAHRGVYSDLLYESWSALLIHGLVAL